MPENNSTEIAQSWERLKAIHAMTDLTIELENERLELINKIETYSDEISLDVMNGTKQIMSELYGGLTKEEREKMRSDAADMNKKAVEDKLARQKKIREGISNTEAEEYVKNLVKENNTMKKEIILTKYENQALKANGIELHKKLANEVSELKDYFSSIQDVVQLFGEKMKNVMELHKVVENNNESESKATE